MPLRFDVEYFDKPDRSLLQEDKLQLLPNNVKQNNMFFAESSVNHNILSQKFYCKFLTYALYTLLKLINS